MSNSGWIADFQASTFLCPRLFMNFHDRLTSFIVSFQNRLWEFHIPTECSVDKVLRKRYFCRVIVFQKVLIEHEFQIFFAQFLTISDPLITNLMVPGLYFPRILIFMKLSSPYSTRHSIYKNNGQYYWPNSCALNCSPY